jgi:hypothetical protein
MTIRENYELVKEISQEMAIKTIESKPVAVGVATTTTAIGITNISDIAAIAGIIATSIVGVRHAFGIWHDYKKSLKDDDDK